MRSAISLQRGDLLRRVIPDLVIGLVGIPIALAYQNTGKTILSLESPPYTYITYFRIVVSFMYLVVAYSVFSFAIIDLFHYPNNWGGRIERRVRTGFILPIFLFLALMGLFGGDLDGSRMLINLAFFSLSIALLPDIIRGKEMISQKSLLVGGWVLAGLLSFLWLHFL